MPKSKRSPKRRKPHRSQETPPRLAPRATGIERTPEQRLQQTSEEASASTACQQFSCCVHSQLLTAALVQRLRVNGHFVRLRAGVKECLFAAHLVIGSVPFQLPRCN